MPSVSGCTPTLAQRLSCATASACTDSNSSMLVQMHSAPPTLAARMSARIASRRAFSSGNARWQWESTYIAQEASPAGARDAPARTGGGGRQMVCVGLDDEIEVPSTSSMRIFSRRVFSSTGKRTPTPCVRPPGALAGVSQPTLPATG